MPTYMVLGFLLRHVTVSLEIRCTSIILTQTHLVRGMKKPSNIPLNISSEDLPGRKLGLEHRLKYKESAHFSIQEKNLPGR